MRIFFLIACLLALDSQAELSRVRPVTSRSARQSGDQAAFRLLPTTASITECSGAALLGTRGEAITVTRASSATCTKSDGTLVTLAANQPRVSLVGGQPMLLVEGPATNYFLNSGAPATQTITHSTGPYIFWMDGTGSVSIAVGTATATGLPCTASNGVACSFNVSVAGTVVYTVTGSPTRAQLELNSTRTSYIATTGTSASRAADFVSTPVPSAMNSNLGCAAAVFKADGAASGNNARIIGSSQATPDSTPLFVSGSTLIGSYQGAVAQVTVPNFTGRKVDAKTTWIAGTGRTTTSITDNLSSSASYSGSPSLLPTAGNNLTIGMTGVSNEWFSGYIGNVRLGTSTTRCDK